MEISQNILPVKMLELFEEAEFESVGRIIIEQLEQHENQVAMTLLIEGGEISDQRWQLIIKNLVAIQVIGLEARWMTIYDEHCLLWDYVDDESELYVNGIAKKSPEHVSASFYELHRTAFGEWLTLEKYTSSAGLLFACQMQQGLFARGPKMLLSQYRDWLNELGKPAYLYESDGLIAYNARKERLRLQVLIMGKSYFIGTQFLFQELAV